MEDGGGQQFFFDQKSLDIAERKRRQEGGHGRGKRNRGRGGIFDLFVISIPFRMFKRSFSDTIVYVSKASICSTLGEVVEPYWNLMCPVYSLNSWFVCHSFECVGLSVCLSVCLAVCLVIFLFSLSVFTFTLYSYSLPSLLLSILPTSVLTPSLPLSPSSLPPSLQIEEVLMLSGRLSSPLLPPLTPHTLPQLPAVPAGSASVAHRSRNISSSLLQTM